MMEINQIKASAMQKLMAGKFPQAIADFTQIIDKVKATSEDKIAVKLNAYSQRSYCNILLKNYDTALEDVNQAIELGESARKPQDIQNMNELTRKEDAIIPLLVEAYVRRGNIYDIKDRALDSLIEYNRALQILPGGDAKTAFDKLLKTCGVPNLKKDDEKLAVFNSVVESILNRDTLLQKLQELEQFFAKEHEIAPRDIEFYASSKAINVPDGVLTFYVRDQEIVLACLKAMHAIGVKGCLPIYSFFEDVKDCIANYPKNVDIVTVAINFLYETPENAFIKFADASAVDPLCGTFELDLPAEISEKVFFILFNIANTDELTLDVCNNSLVLENIEKKKDVGAAMLMSRLTQVKQFAIFAIEKIGIRWMADLLTDTMEAQKATGVLIAITRSLLVIEDVKSLNVKDEATYFIDKLVPVLTKLLKSVDVASNSFAALALLCEYVPEKIHDVRAVRIASLALALHQQKEGAVQNIIAFIYGAANHGLLDDVKEAGTILPTALGIVGKHPTNQVICERVIALAFLMDHPSKKDLVIAGCKQFPGSKILKDILPKVVEIKF